MTVKFKVFGKYQELEMSAFVETLTELCKGIENVGGDWKQFYELNVEIVDIVKA